MRFYTLLFFSILFVVSCNTNNPLKVKRIKKVDENGITIYPPVIIKKGLIRYPAELQKKKIQGKVIIEFTVTKQGLPINFILTQSVPGLNKLAIDALKGFRFLPALNEKKEPIEIQWQIPFNFHLSN